MTLLSFLRIQDLRVYKLYVESWWNWAQVGNHLLILLNTKPTINKMQLKLFELFNLKVS